MNAPATAPIKINIFRRVCWETRAAHLFQILVGTLGIDQNLRTLFANEDHEQIMAITHDQYRRVLKRVFLDVPPSKSIQEYRCNVPSNQICRTMVFLSDVTAEERVILFRAHGWDSGKFQQILFNISIGDYYPIPYTGILVRKVIPLDKCEFDFRVTLPAKQVRCPQCGHEFPGG